MELLDRLRDYAASLEDKPVERVAVVGVGGLLAILLAGNVIAQVLVGGTPSANSEAAIAQLDRVQPGSVLLDEGADPTKLDKPVGIGSRHAGLALLARSQVAKVATDSGPRRAPEGSTLVAFRLGDWDCEEPPCATWQTLEPQLVIDGTIKDLPTGGDTFVVVVPPGTQDVEVTVDADGFSQSVSLLDDAPGESNIALLAQPDPEKRITINQTFRAAERTSIALQDASGQVADVFYRDVTVDYAQRHFFFNGAAPRNPRHAFLIVNVFYTYVGQTARYVPLDEVTFVDNKGRRYPGKDLDPSDSVALLGFEIPADVTRGKVVIGGVRTRTSTSGQSYVATVDVKEIPLKLG